MRERVFNVSMTAFLTVMALMGLIFLLSHNTVGMDNSSQWLRNAAPIIDTVQELRRITNENSQLLSTIYCDLHQVTTTGGFCLSSKGIFSGGNWVWDGKLCASLEKIFGKAKVGDFGAGLGHYGRCFLRYSQNFFNHDNAKELDEMRKNYESGMRVGGLWGTTQVVESWEGYDGAANVDFLSGGRIKNLDLSHPVDLGKTYDWVMSLEVGEHIPAGGEKNFIDNLTKHACKGVVLSWAVPGQGGHHHVNNKDNQYVRDRMKERGLDTDVEAEKSARLNAQLDWFKNTIMVFRYPTPRC